MTTERIIEIFNDYDRISGLLLRGNNEDDSLFNSETVEAMNGINVILHKYQKIEEIVNNTFQNIAKEDERYAYEWLGDIKEVIEDGKID